MNLNQAPYDNDDVDYDDYSKPLPPPVTHRKVEAAFWKKQLVKHLFYIAFGRAVAEDVTVMLLNSKGTKVLLNPRLLTLHHEDAD